MLTKDLTKTKIAVYILTSVHLKTYIFIIMHILL